MIQKDDFEVKKNYTADNEKLRKIYLAKIARGEIFGPMTGKLSVDMPWLKFYTNDQIMGINIPEMTIYDYMTKKNKAYLKDIAMFYYGKKVTYGKFFQLINICGKSMIRNGIKEGDVVTICMPNTPEAVIAFYSLNKIGAVTNLIHPLSGQIQIRNYINEVKSKLIITIDTVLNKVLSIVEETHLEKIVVVSPCDSMRFVDKNMFSIANHSERLIKNTKVVRWNKFLKCGEKYSNDFRRVSFKRGKTTVILHTGGTTGISKGVELTDTNFNAMVEQFITGANNFGREDKMLAVMPIFHGFGLCSSIHLALSVGVSIILIPKLDIKIFHKVLKKYHPNHIIGVPTLFKSMLCNKKLEKMNMSYLKYVVSGGDLTDDFFELEINQFLDRHGATTKLSKGYGLSEAVAGVTFACNGYNKLTSIGIPMIDTNMKIVKLGTEEEVGQGEIGEICVKGPTVMKSYYQNREETDNVLLNGWLHTGDLGYFKNDVFYFKQRKGNMIVSSGINVYPSNIEKIIETHYAVQACAVIGVSHPYKIQVPKAYIVLKEGYEEKQVLEELKVLCKQFLDVYSVPADFNFRTMLPQTLLGKVDYKKLEEEECMLV